MAKRTVKSNHAFDSDPVLKAAWLYYQDGMSQTDVAKAMGLSRVTVVKYLQVARERGLVRISLDFDSYSNIDLALRIKKKFCLSNVVILPDSNQASSRNRFAGAGGAYLNEVIEDGDVLGVAWGRTIHLMSQVMVPKSCRDVTVLQMMGSMPAQPDFTTIESSSQIANKLSGRCVNLHVPAVVSSARLAEELQAEPIIRDNFSYLTKCNKAFFVVGNAEDENPLIRAGVLSAKDMEGFRSLGAVGVICGRFYDKHGHPVYADIDRRILGITLAQLRQIERRIFLAAGKTNFEATLGAIRGGYVSDLIADEETGRFLLDSQD